MTVGRMKTEMKIDNLVSWCCYFSVYELGFKFEA